MIKSEAQRVSVIIPCYNRAEKTLAAALSVLNQSTPPLELIVVDDGSSDHTLELLTQHLGERIKLISLSLNRGPSFARNEGAQIARGHWLAFLDSDDLWLPKKLEKQMQAHESQSQYLWSFTDEIWIRKGVRVNPKKHHAKFGGDVYLACLPLCFISPSSVMIEKKLYAQEGGFNEAYPVCEDYEFWLRLSCQHPIIFVNEKLIQKNGGHEDQLSLAHSQDLYRVRALKSILNSPSLAKKFKEPTLRMLKEKLRILSLGFKKHGKNEEAELFLQELNALL